MRYLFTMLLGLTAPLWIAAAIAAKSEAPATPISHAIPVTDASRTTLDGVRPRRWNLWIYKSNDRPRLYAPDHGLLRAMADQKYFDQASDKVIDWSGRILPGGDQKAPRRQPLILLLPGQGIAAFHYGYLARELTRRGFVVAVVDLPYIGFARGPDRKLRTASDDPLAASEEPAAWNPRVAEWETDLSLSLDALARSRVASMIDFKQILVAGHSLGGAVALDACALDRRVAACADFEGAPLGTRTVETGPVKPTLYVLSRSLKPDRPFIAIDPKSPKEAFLAKGLPVDVWAVGIGGGSHMSFSDAPVVMPDTLSRFGGSLMNAARSMTLYPDLLSAFAKAYLPGGRGEDDFRRAMAAMPETRAVMMKSANQGN